MNELLRGMFLLAGVLCLLTWLWLLSPLLGAGVSLIIASTLLVEKN